MMKSPCLFLVLLFLIVMRQPCTGATMEKPNIIYIMADDMGYADAGFNGGKEIRTPNLDSIAKGGTILSSFYVQPVCSPTRSVLAGRSSDVTAGPRAATINLAARTNRLAMRSRTSYPMHNPFTPTGPQRVRLPQ